MKNNFRISDKGVRFLKAREGEILHVYKDSVGLLTVGVGHLLTDEDKTQLRLNQKITQAESTRLLREDLKRFEKCVNSAVKVPINQNQFDALVSLAFNIGEKGFTRSSVVRRLNARNYEGAANAFLMWNRAGGKVVKGLSTRRTLEKNLFLTPFKQINNIDADSQTIKDQAGTSLSAGIPAQNNASNISGDATNEKSAHSETDKSVVVGSPDSNATEQTVSAEKETPAGTVTAETKKLNEQDVNIPAEVTEPERQGFAKKLGAGLATLFGGTILYDSVGKFAGIQFTAQAIYIIIALIFFAFLGFCVWAVLDTLKKNKKAEIEALSKTSVNRKDIIWVQPERLALWQRLTGRK